MFKLLHRLITQKIYIAPNRQADGEMPEFLSMREIADLPLHHPCTEGKRRAEFAKPGQEE